MKGVANDVGRERKRVLFSNNDDLAEMRGIEAHVRCRFELNCTLGKRASGPMACPAWLFISAATLRGLDRTLIALLYRSVDLIEMKVDSFSPFLLSEPRRPLARG